MSPYPRDSRSIWGALPNLEEKPRLLLGYRLTNEDAQSPRDSSPLLYPAKPKRI